MAASFFDTNVLLYLLSGDAAKADRAEALLGAGDVHISVQVLNEITNVARKKLAMSWEEIKEFLETIRAVCNVHPLTAEVHDHMRAIAERNQISVYDASIVAGAIAAKCKVLYSEDLQHGMVFEKTLRVVNPFPE
jgi:predicted nucleic acid-binding protein